MAPCTRRQVCSEVKLNAPLCSASIEAKGERRRGPEPTLRRAGPVDVDSSPVCCILQPSPGRSKPPRGGRACFRRKLIMHEQGRGEGWIKTLASDPLVWRVPSSWIAHLPKGSLSQIRKRQLYARHQIGSASLSLSLGPDSPFPHLVIHLTKPSKQWRSPDLCYPSGGSLDKAVKCRRAWS